MDSRETGDDVGHQEKLLFLCPEHQGIVRIFQFGLDDKIGVLWVLLFDLEDNLIFELLLNYVNDEQATVIRHETEIFFRVESQKAPFVPFSDSFNNLVFD